MNLLKVAERKPYAWEIDDFCKVFGLIVKAYNKLLPDADKKEHEILYAAQFPDEVFAQTGQEINRVKPHNIVTYEVTQRENGTMGPTAFAGTREVRAHPREEIATVDENGVPTLDTVYGKWYDNYVRFECYAPSALQANELIYRLEGIYEIHASWLDTMGTVKTIYAGRVPPSYNSKSDYHVRAFQVYVKTERQWTRREGVVQRIEYEVGTELSGVLPTLVDKMNALSGALV